tara:strand:+ start:134 stop:967 length:834 start_codon:yes stop_codon:yes gene_type:complete
MPDNKEYCIKHQMADGTIMDGPIHGPGQICVEWSNTKYKKGGTIKNPKFKGNKRRTAKEYSAGGKMAKTKKFSPGGMLVGPSHDNGGIPVIVDGVEPIEVEGGEFIINKQTVDAVGEEFLHKLNSTETTHHTGGFEEGVLPSPSKFKDGGKVNNRRSKMARGRRRRAPRRGIAPARKMARGGRSTGVPKYPHGGSHCGPGMTMAQNGGCVPMSGGGYKRGGRTTPVRSRRGGVKKYPHGGMHGNGMINKECRMHSGDATSCNNHPACTYNYSTGMCH